MQLQHRGRPPQAMSHTVLRGAAYASQLYLDSILDAIRFKNTCSRIVKERDQVNLAEIIYHCMKQKPQDMFMINGSSGEKITYGELLKYSIPLTQAIRANHLEGRTIMFLMRSHEHMAALYYATLFADVVPLMIDPNSTVCEINHFLLLVHPYLVFCDTDRHNDVITASRTIGFSDVRVMTVNNENDLIEFSKGYWGDFENFLVSNASTKSIVILIPTSGSSGLPKATELTHEGLIAQLPIIWSQYDCFPRPTESALLLSSPQWVTHTILMLTCPVYGVTLVMTPQKPTTGHILQIMEKFRPTWSLFNPKFLKSLMMSGSSKQLNSLKTLIVTGSPLTKEVVTLVKEIIPDVHLGNGMGMTETHGFITMPGHEIAWDCNGRIVNTLIFEIIGENFTELGVNQKGELHIKSRICIFKGYYKNEEAYRETVTQEGWYKTGDIIYKNERDEVYFVERKKFWFKYLNFHVIPEELERIISSVPGVQECVVCDSENGPAAAVVLHSTNFFATERLIHQTVNDTLSDYKKLRGGVFFVPSIPCTHSGKMKRKECADLIKCLTEAANTN